MIRYRKVRDVMDPIRSTEHSAGIDFFVPNDFVSIRVDPGESILIPSGIIVQIPDDTVLIAYNKSGVAVKHNLIVGACVVDSDYQGEIHLHVINVGKESVYVEAKQKLVQFIHSPYLRSPLVLDKNIHQSRTERGTGGFGSTGT